ncbi:Rpn family recombination-promoting nuclease/putative transposase [Aerosakkonemataceae cyanobacterium BLCC-F50]|uniref:Rpn family recombination-promoting nuclease/putative transposase n=1 Tax=Floridaenema flaviceps BLCC-F50 TaxID=3153642 RepID=A0ABV4XJV6_9CYAN
MRTDTLFYRLFQEFPGIFFELIDRQYNEARNYEFTSVELKQTAFRMDGVFVPKSDVTRQPVYFVEVQFQLDLSFYRRLFAEIFLYLRQNPAVNLWRVVVIYPNRSVEADDLATYQELIESQRVRRIYLNELGETTSLGIGIVQLIVEREETAIERARRLILQTREEIEDADTTREILELIETILLYKLTQLSREELAEMLGLIDDEFRQTRMYQSIKQEGLEEGKQEGKQEAKLEAVPRLLALGLTVEQIAEALDLSIAQVQSIAESQSR